MQELLRILAKILARLTQDGLKMGCEMGSDYFVMSKADISLKMTSRECEVRIDRIDD